MTVQDNTFLVTGGVSGLGRATARMLTEGGGRAGPPDIDVNA